MGGQRTAASGQDTTTTRGPSESLPVLVARSRADSLASLEVVSAADAQWGLVSDGSLGDILERLCGAGAVKLGPLGGFEAPLISTISGNTVQVWLNGTPYPSKDYRGADLNDLPFTSISSLGVDRTVGRVDVRVFDQAPARPVTKVNVQRGSRGLGVSSAAFSAPLGGYTSVAAEGWLERLASARGNTDFDQETYAAQIRRFVHQGRGELDLLVLRVLTDAGLPRSVAWPAAQPWEVSRRALRHWASFGYDRLVGPRILLSASGWGDHLDQELRYASPTHRTDRILGTSVEGRFWHARRGLLLFSGQVEQGRYEGGEIRDIAGRVAVEGVLGLLPRLWMKASADVSRSSRHGQLVQARVRTRAASPRCVEWDLDLARTGRHPTYDEEFHQAYERTDSTLAQPLSPETGTCARVGCRAKVRAFGFSSYAYWRKVNDWIGLVATNSGALLRNRTDIQVGGVESSLSWRPHQHGHLQVCYDWYKPEAADREPVLHWPEHRASALAKYARTYFDDKLAFTVGIGTAWLSASQGVTEDGVLVDLPEASLVDAEIQMRVLDFTGFYAIRNALDDTAPCWYGYPREGRAFRWGMHWKLWD